MTASEVFLLIVRWLHILAALAWVGGSLFYFLVLRPALRKEGGGATSTLLQRRVGAEFGAVVDTCIIVLVLTGAILGVDRLSSRFAGVPYFTVLTLKVAFSLWMFALAHSRLRGRRELFAEPAGTAPTAMQRIVRGLTWTNLIAILGVVVFLLSDLLRALFELALQRGV
ncbi:MAG: hypothetical protein EXR67_05855 [Dehalococcoidia bacterium]|nr:hypothetical protein [Dehalococcoidia bacterium]